MISTSTAFENMLLESSRHFLARIRKNGIAVECDIKSITINKGACGDDTLTIGSVYSSSAELIVSGLNETLENEDIEIQIGMDVSGSPEYITVGRFTVSKVKASVYEAQISATGFITSKLAVDLPVLSAQTIPAIIAAIQTRTGIAITLSGLTSAGTITAPLTSMTCKEALQLVTFLLGGYATELPNGTIRISKYQIPTNKLAVNGDRMLEPPTFADNAFTMTGVKVIASPESYDDDGRTIPEVSYQTSTTVRQVYEERCMTQALFNVFAANVTGYTYMPGEIPLSLGDPRLEPWDCLAVTDNAGRTYNVPCLQITHTFDGGLSTQITASGAAESDMEVEGFISKQLGQVNTELVKAQDGAAKATGAAARAEEAAGRAEEAAGNALEYAEFAHDALTDIESTAYQASTVLQQIHTDATDAQASAAEARGYAVTANRLANGVLDQLSTVEDVIGVLSWASEHGTFTRTQDTQIVAGKVYFTYDSVTGDYTPVVIPQESDLSQYYELTVNEAMESFIMSHLAVTARGLWVLPGGMGSATDPQYAPSYKTLLSNNGMYVYDGSGVLVTTFGEDITFNSTRSQHIGGNDAYILFDSVNGRLYLGGSKVQVGSKPLSELLDDIEEAALPNLRIDSSRGTVFKNAEVSTVLSVAIYYKTNRITNLATLRSVYNSTAYLQWQYQGYNEVNWHTMSSSDSRLSNDGFELTLTPSDVSTKIVFRCELLTV